MILIPRPPVDVPCNGCTRCCHGDAVRIMPHEDASQWLTEPHPYQPGARMLAHKANDDCVYLGPAGCTIHPNKPEQCRTMDCRNLAREISFTNARKLAARNALPMPIWQRGKELLAGKP
jgi:Fe-S-cluster containining protein